ncbi:hypothetical protein BARVI_09055 [Barnesiella viscericola DSM 18177]|uniref:Outer membrane protein beta-barrel domain-containing protein n=1 Tax=Barnesiella viscericola DSM 18177 TaxID=880074 RepID=W0ESY0_9BACT|nr:hypothetical protein [Barnesiella viscericola]AHF13882.1 hypothetical protein BARVI_09055 [Barnesiella viscericola DSM 18177]
MKKIIAIILSACLFPAMLWAEDKEQKQYLPEEGDWALGIDVVPILKYIGNAFNGTNGSNELSHVGGTPFTSGKFGGQGLMPTVSIMGKYMLTDEWAVRANVGLMISSANNKAYSIDDKALAENPFSEAKVVDGARYDRNGMSMLLGAEYRKGSRRIQGVFGAGLLFAFQNSKETYSWGNALTEINQSPTSHSFANMPTLPTGYRALKQNGAGSDFYLGLTGSAGVEWFVAPKIALGAEVNLSLYYIFGTQTYVESEGYNATLGKVETRTDLYAPGSNGIYFGTESLGGSLYMTFYF